MKILVTGGAGFIGSNFIRYILMKHPDWQVHNLDKLTYAGNLENLRDIENKPGYQFTRGDITDRKLVDNLLQRGFDSMINFAAESHVDRSILEPLPFVETNVNGTLALLEGVRKYQLRPYIQVSTDEVYGSIENGYCTEISPMSPTNPYSASKAAADLLCLAYWKTYGTPVIITRCSNNYGPYQFQEKLIPLAITNIMKNKPIPIYGDGLNVRDWIYVDDHCRALELVLLKGRYGEVYNIGANQGKTNVEVIKNLLQIMGRSGDLITFVTDRPGHDRRYAMDSSKITLELGWKPVQTFKESLAATVDWYAENDSWLRRIKT